MRANTWISRHRIWAATGAATVAVLAVVVMVVTSDATGSSVPAAAGTSTATATVGGTQSVPPTSAGATVDPPRTPAGQSPTSKTPGAGGSGGSGPNSGGVTLPPANAAFDYQLGGAYPPPSGVRTVTRDRTENPVPGLYNICYINGFQTQAEDLAWWRGQHNDLLLHDSSGGYVIDPDWDETLLDISSPAKRTALAAIVGGWIDGCAKKGFQAVELDNLDTWSRSQGLLTQADAIASITLLTPRAHAAGLAIGQKNAVELGGKGKAAGFDFAVAEECGRYKECGGYTAVYGAHVLVIEYRSADFTYACGQWGSSLAIVLRDLNLVAAGRTGYVYQGC